MLAYHEASMGLGAVRQNDKPTYRNDPNGNNQHQHEHDEAEMSKARQCLKKTTKFLFSHIGLVGLVVIYAVAGGFLFQLLEERQEKLNCKEAQGEQLAQITNLKQQILKYVQDNTTASTSVTINKDNTTVAFKTIGSMLYGYRDYVNRVTTKYRYYDDDCSVINKWTYPNALLFAITIITTIGYGNITPVTWEGQLCCICYATIGIPIFLLCVANISGVLGEMFRFIYAKIICSPCSFIKNRRALARKAKLEEENGTSGGRVHAGGWALDNEDKNTSIKGPTNTITANTELDEEEQRRNQRVAVPLTVTMIIIAAYIWIGSVLFHNFEEWTMIQAGYFCFITLATIGFGDFVPGQCKDDPNAKAKLILGAIYVLFGMAILAMCFDLMQEEIVAKFRWIGRKIGIVEKEEEEEGAGEDKTNQVDNASGTKNKKRVSKSDSNTAIVNNENEDENGNEPLAQRSSSASRKASPRSNTARVHPMGTNSPTEGTLHQRVAPTKFNSL